MFGFTVRSASGNRSTCSALPLLQRVRTLLSQGNSLPSSVAGQRIVQILACTSRCPIANGREQQSSSLSASGSHGSGEYLAVKSPTTSSGDLSWAGSPQIRALLRSTPVMLYARSFAPTPHPTLMASPQELDALEMSRLSTLLSQCGAMATARPRNTFATKHLDGDLAKLIKVRTSGVDLGCREAGVCLRSLLSIEPPRKQARTFSERARQWGCGLRQEKHRA